MIVFEANLKILGNLLDKRFPFQRPATDYQDFAVLLAYHTPNRLLARDAWFC